MSFDWKKVAGLVGQAAPIIGSLVGGPVGLVAGKAGQMISEALGCGNSPDEIEAAIKADPQALVKLKALQLTHKAELATLAFQEKELIIKEGIKHREIDTADIQSARSRDLEMKQSGHTNNRADVMIGIAFVALVTIIGMVFLRTDMPAGVLAIFNMTVGYLLKMLGDAFAFEFGSSRGSKEKDSKMEALAALLKQKGF